MQCYCCQGNRVLISRGCMPMNTGYQEGKNLVTLTLLEIFIVKGSLWGVHYLKQNYKSPLCLHSIGSKWLCKQQFDFQLMQQYGDYHSLLQFQNENKNKNPQPNNEMVGPCSIPKETTHNYPSDSSNQLTGKILLFQFTGFFLPRPESFMFVLL